MNSYADAKTNVITQILTRAPTRARRSSDQ